MKWELIRKLFLHTVTSIFTDKTKLPDVTILREVIVNMYWSLIKIRDFVSWTYPKAIEEWNSPSLKYGWSCKIKDKKRSIIYQLPRKSYFLVAFDFGVKATSAGLASHPEGGIKNTSETAKVYAEGRYVWIEIGNRENLEDIK